MNSWIWLWYALAGFILGWSVSTLTEWLWFRRQRVAPGSMRPPPPGKEDVSQAETAAPSEDSVTPAVPAPKHHPPAHPLLARAQAEMEPQPATPAQGGDDLTEIQGIDQLRQEQLHRAGIFTYRQLAGASPEELARAIGAPTEAVEPPDYEDWIVEATKRCNGSGT
jgi:predicted flap endonuclease-1-like 5' DNA nuclease